MAETKLTVAQLRALVAASRRRYPHARVVGVQAPGGWAGGDQVDCDGQSYAVVRAGSPLALRAALRDAAASRALTVIVTAASDPDLGLDVRARVAGRQLATPDLWESVRGLFGARDVDPAARIPSVGMALLEHAPAAGYPPVATGLLDPGTAWRCVFRHAFGFPEGEPTEPSLVAWAVSDAAAPARYGRLPADLREAGRRRLTDTLGPAAGVVLDVVDAGTGADAAALGLAFEVVYADDPPPPALVASAARLERHHGGRPVTVAVARRLARATAAALDQLPDGEAAAHRRRADAIVAEVQATAALGRGTQTPGSWEVRLAGLGNALAAAVDGPGRPTPAALAAVRARLADLRGHALKSARGDEFARAETAARLLGWLAADAPIPGDPAELAAAYRDDVSFADRARDRISGVEAGAGLSAAYRILEERAAHRRADFNRRFADALATGESPGALPVERFLDEVLVPIAGGGHRVLLIVLDGFSWAVAHELRPELHQQGWNEATWLPSGAAPPPLLAAVPSVTEVSRASLFCGALTRGDATAERAGFAGHRALASACDRKHPPVLYHKAAVADMPRGGLTKDVRQSILSPKTRVVAVVVNAIDDELAGAEQIRGRWTVDAIGPLSALLHDARDSERLVLLAGDHGHVWHRAGAYFRKAGDAGERWRPVTGGAPEPGEIVIRGPRVQDARGGNAVIVPWAEGVRYGIAKKGYHGGITPQEMLAPVLLLTHASAPAPKGVPTFSPRGPEWWSVPQSEPRPVQVPAHPPAPAPTRPTGTILDLIPAAGHDDSATPAHPEPPPDVWIDQLLQTDLYRLQRATVGKPVPGEADTRRILEVLCAERGEISLDQLERRVGLSRLQLDELLAKLQRILNVDGYEVLGTDRATDRVLLNSPLLLTQFGIV